MCRRIVCRPKYTNPFERSYYCLASIYYTSWQKSTRRCYVIWSNVSWWNVLAKSQLLTSLSNWAPTPSIDGNITGSDVSTNWHYHYSLTKLLSTNERALNRHLCGKTTVLSCYKCLINTGVEKNEQHSNLDYSFHHQMSLSKSKRWYSNNCLHFLKGPVLLTLCVVLAGN